MIIGLVGKPSSGKSTFFKASTLANVDIAPYPFTTINKNEGIAYVKVKCVDSEFNTKCQPKTGFCKDNFRFIPIKLIDVAGLVPDAHKGKGRGNAFLDDLSEADILIQVVDTSGKTDKEGNPTENNDVSEEIQFLRDEIAFWINGILAKNWERFSKKIHSEKSKVSTEIAKVLSGLKIREEEIIDTIKELNLNDSLIKWSKIDLLNFSRKIREKTKPILIAANKIDSKSSAKNLELLKERFKDQKIFACSAESELALREASKKELISYTPGDSDFKIKKELTNEQSKALDFVKNEVLDKYGNTGIQQTLNSAVFDFLEMTVAYPVDNDSTLSDKYNKVLPDAFLMKKNSTALDFAEKIHTDFAKTFGTAIDVRTKKRLGKEYILNNNDVIRITTKYS